MLPSVFSNNCAVHFNEKAYQELNIFLKEASYFKVVILVDENTRRYCLADFMMHLEGDYAAEVIEIGAGEAYKNIETCTQVWGALSDLGVDKKSVFIALGGGVVTDLGGFAASTYRRGIDFINVPTSLLAMADASIGGKTGVDLGVIKNGIGVINFPKMVVIDNSFLKTLPARHLRSGMAEMLKHGLIHDERYWNKLSKLSTMTIKNLDELIYESVKIKNTIVEQDVNEYGFRKILNYGHTLGHAIESCFLNTKTPLLHGEAIAIGMILAAYISHITIQLPLEKLNNIKKGISSYFDNVNLNEVEYKNILSFLKHDKKNTHGNINFVLLNDIGKPVINQSVTEKLIVEAFKYYKS